MKRWLEILLALGLGGAPCCALGNSGNPKAAPGASPGRLDIPIPIKHDAQGVKLPYYDEHDRLQMYFSIVKATRVDMDHLLMRNAYMQTYDEKETPDANVYMTRSVLDLNTRVVTSEIPVTIRRQDFEINGQKMVFDTQHRVGHLTGHVQMIIYNLKSAPAASPAPEGNSAPIPAGSPAAAQSAEPSPKSTP